LFDYELGEEGEQENEDFLVDVFHVFEDASNERTLLSTWEGEDAIVEGVVEERQLKVIQYFLQTSCIFKRLPQTTKMSYSSSIAFQSPFYSFFSNFYNYSLSQDFLKIPSICSYSGLRTILPNKESKITGYFPLYRSCIEVDVRIRREFYRRLRFK
jgi:hypothetical protein